MATKPPIDASDYAAPWKQESAFLGENSVLLRAITATSLLTTFNAGGVESTADDLITNAREVADTTAADQDDGVFLKLVAFARNVDGDFFVVRQTNTGDTTKRGIRLFRLHRTDEQADATLLRATFEDRGLRAAVLLFAVFTHPID